MHKILQTKSLGVTLGVDLERALKEAVVAAPKDKLQTIECFVKDKKVRDMSFEPFQNAIITFLLPADVYRKPYLSITPDMLVYEDDAIVVIDKPAGVSTQGTQKFGEDHLFGALIAYYTKTHVNKLAYVGLHHRLDRDTSGLVLFTKKSSANKAIAEQFQAQAIKKKYTAIVVGPKPELTQWVCEEPIKRDFASTKIFRFKVDKKGDSAKTEFRWLEEVGENRQLVECTPYTGRTHQIRIHLRAANLPILGDRTYGNTPHIRMMLHANELQFTHPLTKKMIVGTSAQSLKL